MGSRARPLGAVAPQQPLPPLFTRSAACPYFSLTTSLMSGNWQFQATVLVSFNQVGTKDFG